MKTYEERKNETCQGRAKGEPFTDADRDIHCVLGRYIDIPCTALSREDYEAELRAEIEKLRAYGNEMGEQLEHDRSLVADCITHATEEITGRYWLTEGRGPYEWNDDRWHGEFAAASTAILAAIKPMRKVAADWKGCPTGATEICQARIDLKMRVISLSDELGKLRAAFDSIATVIQGAYLNGQLPPISDAELAEKIITDYSTMRAGRYEEAQRAGVAEKTISDDYWDQHAVQCGNCSVEILTRGEPFKPGGKVSSGLSDTGDSEDEALCGMCAGHEMYRLMDLLDQRGDADPTNPDALPGCADDTVPRSNVDTRVVLKVSRDKLIEAQRHTGLNYSDLIARIDMVLADASPQPESAERKENAGE